MNTNGRTVMVPEFANGKLSFEPADDLMDRGVELSDTLQIIWNKKRTDLSINRTDDTPCVFHFEIHDGKLECVYFDSSQLG